MSKIYNKLENDFTQIPNTILQDARINALAFKIYCYICFRIGRNSEWEFYNNEILQYCQEGKHSLMKAKRQLIECGYLEKVKQNHKQNGDFGGCDYIIYKEPLTLATSKIASTLEATSKIASTLECTTNNKDTLINKEIKNKEPNKEKNIKKENLSLLEIENLTQDFIQSQPNITTEEGVLLQEYIKQRYSQHKTLKRTETALKSVFSGCIDMKKQGIAFQALSFFKDRNGDVCQKVTSVIEMAKKSSQNNQNPTINQIISYGENDDCDIPF